MKISLEHMERREDGPLVSMRLQNSWNIKESSGTKLKQSWADNTLVWNPYRTFLDVSG